MNHASHTENLTRPSENGPSITLASLFYDAEGRRDQLARDATGAITGYGYDPISRLASLSHDLDGAGTTNDASFGFGYNPASQISTRSLSNNAYEYPVTSSTRSYAVNGRNQYTQVGGTNHGWDANGNLSSDGATTFGYDTENRLTSASGAKNASLTYDPLGQLFEVTSGASTTRFVYDGDRLIAEYSGSGTLLRRYVHGPGIDEPLIWYEGASVSSATRRYLHADHQGSIVAASHASGAMQQLRSYDAYGVTAPTNTLRFQYTGQAAITELGLLYYKARFYNPNLGRFMQTDPIGYEDELNLYAYVGNDPLNKTDPTGECPICVGTGIGALVGAAVEGYRQYQEGKFDGARLLGATAAGAIVGAAASIGAVTLAAPLAEVGAGAIATGAIESVGAAAGAFTGTLPAAAAYAAITGTPMPGSGELLTQGLASAAGAATGQAVGNVLNAAASATGADKVVGALGAAAGKTALSEGAGVATEQGVHKGLKGSSQPSTQPSQNTQRPRTCIPRGPC